jgi:predicted transposase YbfD/YdcC
VAAAGKTSRGARRADGTRVHLPGVAEHGGHLLDHLEVDDGHNETSHFTALLEPLDLDGTVVTSDALHTVRANLNWLAADKKAHYIAVVKGNQPSLHARIKALPWRQVPGGSTARETGHGRTETRTLKAAHVSRLDFPHARQAIKITRWRKDTATGKISRETAYAVTSLTSDCATAQDLARLVREHWSIEAHHHATLPSAKTPRPAVPAAGLPTWPPSGLPSSRPSKTPATCTSPKADATTALPPKPSDSTASIRTGTDIHGTRRSPGL